MYTRDLNTISGITNIKPFFGDQMLLLFFLNEQKPKIEPVKRRDWRKYFKEYYAMKQFSSFH